MKNREKYREEILRFISRKDVALFCEFVRTNVLPRLTDCTNGRCAEFSCSFCQAIFAFWLDEEYEEPEVDWNNVPVDALVRVRNRKENEWVMRYFKGIDEKRTSYKFMVWTGGKTSKTVGGSGMEPWKYCELVEDEDGNSSI